MFFKLKDNYIFHFYVSICKYIKLLLNADILLFLIFLYSKNLNKKILVTLRGKTETRSPRDTTIKDVAKQEPDRRALVILIIS